MSKRRNFSIEEKLSVLREVEENGITETCRRHDLSHSVVSRWRRKFESYTWIDGNTYTWIDGNTYTESNNTATFTITGGAANGCDSIVTLDLTIISVNTGTGTAGSTITSDASGAAYQWLDCDNCMAVIPGETNQSFTAVSSGSYAVEVTENGCTDLSACTEITTVNEIENSLEEQFLAYPNPTTGMITIEFENAQEYLDIRLMSATGQMVETTSIRNSAKKELEIKGPSGNYFIEISDSNGRRVILSIIKS